jgi:two-component system chemotaxis response regulator CheY
MVKSIVARCVMGIRVLVVDDSGFMRKRIVEELKAQGHSVVGEAKGGNEAVELYRTLRPDLVTMDITMRDKDGITAAKEILSEDPDANILFLTILNDEKYKAEAEKLGGPGGTGPTAAGYSDLNRGNLGAAERPLAHGWRAPATADEALIPPLAPASPRPVR